MPSGFTLIELLVVITIIVVLLAMLAPAMDKAITAAEVAVCGSNLHLFGTAVPQYAMENRRRIHSTVVWRSSPTLSPEAAYPHPIMARPFSQPAPGQWNIQAMAPYVGGADLDRRIFKAPWYCPSNAANKDLANSNTSQTGELDGVFGDRYVDLDYAYYGAVSQWDRNHCTRPQDLVSRAMGEGKILMSDTLFYWAQGDGWWLNHSEFGSSVHGPDYGGQVLRGRQILYAVSGQNELLGDGGVVWKNKDQYDFDALDARDINHPWISNVSLGPEPHPGGDIHFY